MVTNVCASRDTADNTATRGTKVKRTGSEDAISSRGTREDPVRIVARKSIETTTFSLTGVGA